MALHALLSQRIRVVHLKNRILLHDSEQHQHADGAVHIDRHTESHQHQQTGRQAQRQRGHDRQGVNKAVELRRENHVDEYNRQKHGNTEIVGGLGQLLRASAEHQSVARLHVQLGYSFANCGNSIAQRYSVQAGVQLNIALAVVALNAVRAIIQLQLRYVAKADDALSRRRHQQASETRRIIAELLVQAKLDLILFVT